MSNHDKLISKIFIHEGYIRSKYYRRFVNNPEKYKNKYNNIKRYIFNRFDDACSLREIIYRIHKQIEHRPKCKICNKPLNLWVNHKKDTIFPTYCSVKCEMSDPEVMRKHNESCLAKYGSVNNSAKTKQTCLNKYGVKAGYNNGKERITKLKKYGSETYNNYDKHKKTCLERYNSVSWASSEIGRKTLSKILLSKEIKDKINNTKRKNHTFNTSKIETESYKLLKEKYPDVVYQYKSDVYPFICDFYIPSLDLYIECNYHWTHGGKPFENNEDDQAIVKKWKDKQSLYYNIAINTWTVRDPHKREIAKQNHLNYQEFWNIGELHSWLSSPTIPK